MGLFDRKRPDSEPQPSPEPRPKARAAEPVTPKAGTIAEDPKPSTKAAESSVAARSRSDSGATGKASYGIQNAIELMRQLPSDNVPLVVDVVKKTLESLNVDIGSIIDDATRKHARIDDRVSNLEAEIHEFEDEIAARKQEIQALTADRDETKTVKERLELAQQRTSGSTPTARPSEPTTPSRGPAPASAGPKTEARASSWGSQAAGTLENKLS